MLVCIVCEAVNAASEATGTRYLLVVASLEQVGIWRVGNVERHLGRVGCEGCFRTLEVQVEGDEG